MAAGAARTLRGPVRQGAWAAAGRCKGRGSVDEGEGRGSTARDWLYRCRTGPAHGATCVVQLLGRGYWMANFSRSCIQVWSLAW